MKILHVIPSVSPVHGGPTVALQTITRALAAEGIEVHVATTDDDGTGHLPVPLGEPIRADGVTYWYFHRQTQFYKFSLPLTRWLAKHIADYDLAHIHTLFSYATLPAAFFACQHHVPYIVRPLGTLNHYGMTRHHPRFKRISFPLIERPILDRAAMIHFTSEQERAEAAAWGMTAPSRIIPIAIEPGTRSTADADQWLARVAPHLVGQRLILFMARLDPKKGLDLLLPAFAQLSAGNVQAGLLIAGAGDPTYVAALEECARALNVSHHVAWLGRLDGEAKQAALTCADMFVLPSYSENFGIAAVEAMAAGLPVVVSDQVGIHDQVSAHGAGVVVPLDRDALASALRAVLNDEQLRHEMGRRGRELVAEYFSVGAMTRELIGVYDELGHHPRRSAGHSFQPEANHATAPPRAGPL